MRHEGKGGGRGSHARSLVVKEDCTQRGRVLVSVLCLRSHGALFFAQRFGERKAFCRYVHIHCLPPYSPTREYIGGGGGENEFPNMVENVGNGAEVVEEERQTDSDFDESLSDIHFDDSEEERDLALDDGFDLPDLAPPINTEQTPYFEETTSVRPTPHNGRNKLPMGSINWRNVAQDMGLPFDTTLMESTQHDHDGANID
ncbi:hypothetical protein SESBI_47476 [Sesbania bispinosa]|nr:hypothetical protein SESBI_47476 [Sesbania bispinosa]